MNRTILSILVFFIVLQGCKTVKSPTRNTSEYAVKFIGEQIIPTATTYKNTKVGGLSGIDYASGKYYLISDDKNKPVRFYNMNLTFDTKGFSKWEITSVTFIQINDEHIDPEALRFDKSTRHFLWTSEGAISKGVSPAIFEIDNKGHLLKKYRTPKIFLASDDKNYGPRNNGTFEGLSMDKNPDYYWVGMELPLKQDGEKPKLKKTNSPVRITKINKNSDEVKFQFAYNLDPVPKNSKPPGLFTVNGLSEILCIGEKKFIFIERAYAFGYKDGGNTIKLYLVDATNATDIKNVSSLKTSDYVPAKKDLLFDFESIRTKLTDGIVDNIEGITFGPDLPNGHKTLVLVSDNNFSKFSPQLNQIIVLEIVNGEKRHK
ncbi:MAG TPA: esterase-like activity of phytase family protein [Saprospiraceae bacterium]|nr:esterase-like activity of phytase family protein [Saprospiraceae bacterium]